MNCLPVGENMQDGIHLLQHRISIAKNKCLPKARCDAFIIGAGKDTVIVNPQAFRAIVRGISVRLITVKQNKTFFR